MPEQMSEEHLKALQEKIKNMSPEELKEWQKKQCIFCQIIAGKVQSRKVYEDEKILAILDINPANPGHVLLLPKEHYSIMPQMPKDEISYIFTIAKRLSNTLLRGIGAQGTNILVANGVAAGQRAQHFMVHVIPRMGNDGIEFNIPQNSISENTLNDIQKKLSPCLGSVIADRAGVIAPFVIPDGKAKEEKPALKQNAEEKKGTGKTLKDSTPGNGKQSGDESRINLDDIASLLGGR